MRRQTGGVVTVSRGIQDAGRYRVVADWLRRSVCEVRRQRSTADEGLDGGD
jgi:hypothetical protein